MQSKRNPPLNPLIRWWGGSLLIALTALAACPTAVFAGAFTAGNLVIVATTGGSGTNTGSVSLLEYTTAGVANGNSVALPSSGSGNRLTLTTNQLEGSLSFSDNGQFLTLGGYNTNSGTAFSSATNRTIARVDMAGNVDVSTTTTNFGGSGERIRSVTSSNGNQLWVAGGNGTGEVGTSTLGSTGALTTVNSTVNPRAVSVVNGQLYGSTATTIFRTDTALPTGSSSITTLVTGGTGSFTNAASFVLLDRDAGVAGVDTMYVADPTNGLFKFSFNGTSWTQQGSDGGQGIFGLTGVVNGSSASLFATTFDGTTLLAFTDTGAFNSTLTGAFSELTTAPGGVRFRGIAIVPEPGSLLLGCAVCAGFSSLAYRRYRRNRLAAV